MAASSGEGWRWRCCLSGRSSLSLESIPLPSPESSTTSSNSNDRRLGCVGGGTLLRSSAALLEDALDDYLAYAPPDAEGDDGEKDPVSVYLAEDAHLLKCRPPPPTPPTNDGGGATPAMTSVTPTVLGFLENAALYDATRESENGGRDGGYVATHDAVVVSLHRPRLSPDSTSGNGGVSVGGPESGCGCVHPRGDWSPRTSPASSPPDAGASGSGGSDASNGAVAAAAFSTSTSSLPARLRVVDLTELQASRRRCQTSSSSSMRGGCRFEATELGTFETTVGACHLLRSVLRCFDDDDVVDGDCTNGGEDANCEVLSSAATMSSSHCASPWSERYYVPVLSSVTSPSASPPQKPACRRRDTVIALLVSGHLRSDDDEPPGGFDDDDDGNISLEQSELRSLLSFRTGDASPSYYLHSSAKLMLPLASMAAGGGGDGVVSSIFSRAVAIDSDNNGRVGSGGGGGDDDGELFGNIDNAESTHTGARKSSTLLVYRHLPPRDHLKAHHPLGHAAEAEEAVLNAKEMRRRHCLWEGHIPPKEEEKDGDDEGGKASRPAPQAKPNDDGNSQQLCYRPVAPPYQSHAALYPAALEEFLTPANLSTVIAEARSIPQWTAWPETTHYSPSPDGSSEVSWTVFPLCHTFPANDPNKRKFIHKTCQFVPETTRLLRSGKLGEVVRTALFSKMRPKSNLGAHTGWADLANHVLRVHVPLIVPGCPCPSSPAQHGGDDEHGDTRQRGLCGTWVDGCVETHSVGVPVVFDDSKVHRAFNYAEEDRVVLIIDLARDGSVLPRGTATGGHTEELDEFIKELM